MLGAVAAIAAVAGGLTGFAAAQLGGNTSNATIVASTPVVDAGTGSLQDAISTVEPAMVEVRVPGREHEVILG